MKNSIATRIRQRRESAALQRAIDTASTPSMRAELHAIVQRDSGWNTQR